MIDLHCHILPGIDDGPETMEGSVALGAAAAADGTQTIVATPHGSWEWRANSAASIAAAVQAVNHASGEAGVAVEVLAGARSRSRGPPISRRPRSRRCASAAVRGFWSSAH